MNAVTDRPASLDGATLAAMPRLFAASTPLARLAGRVVANADFARRGARLVDAQQLELGPFAAVGLTTFGDWEANPHANRSWQWRLNWLSFVSYLIAHHAASGDAGAIRLAFTAVRSWIAHFGTPEARHRFEFAWHDHATALRAEQLALLLHYVQTRDLWSEPAEGDAAATAVACAQHAALLAEDAFFSRHTNHGLEQARVLLLLGGALAADGDAAAAGWRDIALARIESEMRHTFTDEGVHIENSPGYHAFVFKVLIGIVDDHPGEPLGPLRSWLDEVGPRALDFLARILRPDGTTPIIGDTQAQPVSDSFRATFEGHPAYEAFRHAQSLGQAGVAPELLHRVWPKSGWAVFRSGWPPPAQHRRAMHVVFKAGATSRYHRQQDDGHLVVCHHGEDWLIDSGMFGYDSHSPIRQYMRSRAAHNVVVLDRPLAEHDDAAAAWEVVAWSEQAGQPFVTVRNRLYAGATLLRRLSVQAGRGWRVEDTIVSDDGRPFDATLLWHFPADKAIETVGPSEFLVRSVTGRHALRLRLQGDLPDNASIRRGVNKGKVWSVVSTAANSYLASQALILSAKNRSHVHLHSVFLFEACPGGSTLPSPSTRNIS